MPLVTHVHGSAGVGDESDGYAEAWFLPDAANVPGGYATVGTWYDFFREKAAAKGFVAPGTMAWEPGSAVFQYPNTQRASTVWYHDHTLGMTRLDVYAGPAPKENDRFPPNKRYHEIPIAIQDRSFNADGSLFYPGTRAFFDGIVGPYIGGHGHHDGMGHESAFSPIWNPEFFGNEGGFLVEPVDVTGDHGNRLLLGLAERADVIVDFTQVPEGSYVLGNVGPDEPFGGGEPGVDFEPADPDTTGKVLQFRVVAAMSRDDTTPPARLALPAIEPLPAGVRTRPLALIEEMGMGYDADGHEDEGPLAAVLGTVENGEPRPPEAGNAGSRIR